MDDYQLMYALSNAAKHYGDARLNIGEINRYCTLKEIADRFEELVRFKEYFTELYGEGLEIANWHFNGDLEPFDTFYEGALEYETECKLRLVDGD